VGCVPDIDMAQEILNEPGVHALVRQRVSCRMAQHVWVHIHVQSCLTASLADDIVESIDAQRPAPLGLEHIQPRHQLAQLAQVPQFVSVEAVRAFVASLDAGYVNDTLVEVDL
jgi:hypothetical protein